MTAFSYTAISLQGSGGGSVTGRHSAADAQTLREDLRRKGLIVIEARPLRAAGPMMARMRSDHLRRADVRWFFETLTTLLEGRVPIEFALSTMGDLAPNPRIGRVCTDVRERLCGGETLADCLEPVPGLVSQQHAALVRAGHESGRLDRAVKLVHESITYTEHIRQMLVGRLLYPLVLLVVALIALWGISTFVIPKFAQTLEALGGQLPLATRLTLGFADVLMWIIPGLIASVAILIATRRRWFTLALRAQISRLMLRLPVVGSLAWHHQAAGVCETLATMLDGGGDLISGLEQAQEVLSSPEIATRLERTRGDVRAGVDLGTALSAHDVLPPLVLATIRAGISGGDLPGALRRACVASLERQDRVSQRLMTMLEPAVIGVLALAVLWIVYALVSGMLAMNDLQGL